jgi:hydrogenase maturation protease
MPPESAAQPGAAPQDTVVLGLGNPILGDDSAGLRVAEAVRELLRQDPVPGVRVLTSTRAGFELIDLLAGARRAVIIDCLEAVAPDPGRIRRLTLAEVAGASRLVGQHDIGVAVAFELAASLGVEMPDRVVVYGIEGRDSRTFGERLSPEVEAAVETLARQLHADLKRQAASQET